MSPDSAPLPVTTMTSRQLERRRRLTDAVIGIVSETGPENLQMRDVAERSGVALGTIYRYFVSKDHLLAAAWADWHERLTSDVMAALRRRRAAGNGSEPPAGEQVLAFVQRELRAFQRNPNFARLAVHLEGCAEPLVSQTIVALGEENNKVMAALMAGVPDGIARPAALAINSTLGSSLTAWTTGRITITRALRNLEDVTRLVLRDYQ